MAAKLEKNVPEIVENKPIVFTCKFCGETKPLDEMVIIRRYFPQLTACNQCSKNRLETDPAQAIGEDKTA
jgi:hypothetical protein